MRSSVAPPIAERTPTTSFPASRAATSRRATACSRSGPATDVPPNFWTTRPMLRRYVSSARGKGTVAGSSSTKMPDDRSLARTCSNACREFAHATRGFGRASGQRTRVGGVERLRPTLVAERLRRRHRAYPCTGRAASDRQRTAAVRRTVRRTAIGGAERRARAPRRVGSKCTRSALRRLRGLPRCTRASPCRSRSRSGTLRTSAQGEEFQRDARRDMTHTAQPSR